jgi:hypothetical protein
MGEVVTHIWIRIASGVVLLVLFTGIVLYSERAELSKLPFMKARNQVT